MVSSLSVYYRKLAYHVIESDGFLWVGFKPGMVHFIAKEVWNIRPLTRTDVERYYEEFTVLTQGKGSLYFRIVAHGGFLKEALAYELHGLTVSDDNYLRSLNSGRHVELYPHNEKAYRAIIKALNSIVSVPLCKRPGQESHICWLVIYQTMPQNEFAYLLQMSQSWRRSKKR